MGQTGFQVQQYAVALQTRYQTNIARIKWSNQCANLPEDLSHPGCHRSAQLLVLTFLKVDAIQVT